MIYEDDYLEEYLQHHGIKGMKWGVRRPVGSNGLIIRTAGKLKTYRRAKTNSAVKTVLKTTGRLGMPLVKASKSLKSRPEKKRKKIQEDIDNLKSNKNKMLALKSKSGKPLFVEKDIDDMIASLEAKKKKKG